MSTPDPTGGALAQPEDAGSQDLGEWAGNAGLDAGALPDPGDVKSALDFWGRYGGETEVYTAKDLDQRVNDRLREHVSSPEGYNALSEYFQSILKAQGWVEPQAAQAAQAAAQAATLAEGEPAQAVTQQQLLAAVEQRFGPKLNQYETALTELMQSRKAEQQQQQLKNWHGQFETRLSDAVQRHSNGVIPPDRLGTELRRRFATREFQDESPAGLQKAVRQLTEEMMKAREDTLRSAGISPDAVRAPAAAFANKKMSDVIQDDETFNKMVEAVLGHNMPLGT